MKKYEAKEKRNKEEKVHIYERERESEREKEKEGLRVEEKVVPYIWSAGCLHIVRGIAV